MRIYPLECANDIQEVTVGPSRTLKPHNTPVVSSVIDPTGTLLATGSADGVTKVWDLGGAYTTHTFHGQGSVVTSLCFFQVKQNSSKSAKNADKKGSTGFRIAVGYEDGQIRTWGLETRRSAGIFESHVSVVRALDYDPKSDTLLSASRDKTIILWNVLEARVKSTIPALESIEAAAFLTPTHFVAGGEGGRLRIWNISQKQELSIQSRISPSSIIQLVINSSSKQILSVHVDLTLRLLSSEAFSHGVPSERQLTMQKRISGTHDEIIDFGLVGGSRNHLAVATNVEEIKILSLESGASSDENSNGYFGSDAGLLEGHKDIVICLDVDWSGHWLVSGAKDNTARLWRIDPSSDTFECVATLAGHAESIGAVALPRVTPPEGSTARRTPLEHPPSFIITGSQDKTVKRWVISKDKESNNSARATYTRKAHDKDINALDTDPKSVLFASASQDRTVKIWSVEEGEVVGILRGHRRGVWSVKFATQGTPPFTTDGKQASNTRGYVLTGSGDKTVKIWSLTDYSCLRTFEGHSNSVLKVVWLPLQTQSPKAADDDSGTDLDDAEAEKLEGSIAKSSQQVASAGADGLVKVWDVPSGELATTLDNHTDRVWALLAHPGQGALISGGGDGVITWWKDTTSNKAAASAAASTARIEEDQRLQNFMRIGSYREAITLALQLNHPARLLSLFTAVVGKYPPEYGSLSGVRAVDEVIANLSDEQLLSLLGRVRDWNTNAKTAPVAQRILWTILKSYPPRRLLNLRSGKGKALKEMLDALRSYTERHYTRMEELIDESYLVEYTLQEMDEMGGTSDSVAALQADEMSVTG